MIEKISITIDCLSDEERYLTVYVPDFIRKDERLPVIYMMDGQNVFYDKDATYGKSWGMFDYLIKHNTRLIVVGIDSSRNPDNTRLCEYSPYSYKDFKFGKITGRGKTYINWIVEELKPFIDENYPTLADREHTMIAGSSMGGLISYYACLARNDVFGKAACLSPSLWVDNMKLVSLAKKTKCNPNTTIYLDYGSRETKGKFGKMAYDSFWNCVDVLRRKEIHLYVHAIQFGEHNEASWERQLPVFLPLLLKED
ncbi:MAG: alpha/beta hydrolase-fold protein [Erysipelotrichaceae bacterium]|nr:alpha/beta hydrolase-fold protein [Erysipelotrichaceae bacterium]